MDPARPAAPARRGCRWAYDRFLKLFIRDEDTPLQALRRECCLVSVLFLLIAAPMKVASSAWVYWPGLASTLVGIMLFIYTLAMCASRKGVTDRRLTVYVVLWMALIFFADFDRVIASKPRAFSAGIVVFDLLLMLKAEEWLLLAAVVTLLLQIIVFEVEIYGRFGLFDLPGLMPYEERLLHCKRPPCAPASVDPSVSSLVVGGVVLLIDFFITRRFAMKAQQSEERLRASVDASAAIATHMSTFDLEGAKEAMATAGGVLPVEMRAAFDKILRDLRSYRAYLPMMCLVEQKEESTSGDAASVSTIVLNGGDGSVSARSTTSRRSAWKASSRSQLDVQDGAGDGDGDGDGEDGRVVDVRPMVPLTALSLEAAGDPQRSSWGTDFRLVRATVVVLNMCGSTARYGEDLGAFVRQHEQILSFLWDTAMGASGIVDRFVGDRFHLSFNALRRTSQHAAVAVRVAQRAIAVSGGELLSGAVANGMAHVGVLGSVKMRAPAVLGSGYQMCDAMLRACRGLDVRLVCNNAARQDVWHEEELRLLLYHVDVNVTAGSGSEWRTPTGRLLWQVVLAGELGSPEAKGVEDSNCATGVGEWMYEVAEATCARWEVYNQAGLLYLMGDQGIAMRIIRGVGVEPRVREEFLQAVGVCSKLVLHL